MFYVMQFYEFADEDFKKLDERGKDNQTSRIVAEQMQLLQQSLACSFTAPRTEGPLEGAPLTGGTPQGVALWVELR